MQLLFLLLLIVHVVCGGYVHEEARCIQSLGANPGRDAGSQTQILWNSNNTLLATETSLQPQVQFL